MQPQQADPSSAEPAQDAPVAAETPSGPVEEVSRGTSILQRLWRGRNGRFVAGSNDDQATEAAEPAQPSKSLPTTQEELEKRVQAETDRREAKRLEAARAAERRKLRDENPWEYAEQERKAELQAEQSNQTLAALGQVGTVHDRYSIDPVVNELPQAERDRILAMEGAGVGLDGRKLIVTESLKALEKHWKAEGARDAEAKLRRNPAFRKQIFSEFRRGIPEPEFISGGASSADNSVSDILRGQLGTRRSL